MSLGSGVACPCHSPCGSAWVTPKATGPKAAVSPWALFTCTLSLTAETQTENREERRGVQLEAPRQRVHPGGWGGWRWISGTRTVPQLESITRLQMRHRSRARPFTAPRISWVTGKHRGPGGRTPSNPDSSGCCQHYLGVLMRESKVLM